MESHSLSNQGMEGEGEEGEEPRATEPHLFMMGVATCSRRGKSRPTPPRELRAACSITTPSLSPSPCLSANLHISGDIVLAGEEGIQLLVRG